MDEMTLEQVRDSLRKMEAEGQWWSPNSGMTHWTIPLKEMADAIDAKLTQPAQAVDVGAIREVIDSLSGEADSHDDEGMPSTAAYLSRLAIKLTRAIGNAQAVVTITPSMVHEAEAHVPCALGSTARWEWIANYLNAAMAKPNKPCECCGVTPAGDILATDHDD